MNCRTCLPGLIALLGSLAWLPSQAAGQVELHFVQPQDYADIGWGMAERERNLQVLSDHVRGFGERLPDGQRLRVDVLDIDLAGETRRLYARPEVRVLNGRLDGPRMILRWTLSDAAGVQRSGESRLSDPAYLMVHGGLRGGDALPYDRRMLDRWLSREVLAGAQAR